MKTTHIFLMITRKIAMKRLMVSVILLLSFSAYAKDGNDKYSPTKLEWFVLEMNATLRLEGGLGSVGVMYVGIPPSTVKILVQYYSPIKSLDIVEKIASKSKKSVETMKKAYGWNWIKVEVEMAPIDISELKDKIEDNK